MTALVIVAIFAAWFALGTALSMVLSKCIKAADDIEIHQ